MRLFFLLLFLPGIIPVKATKAQAVVIGHPADTSVCNGGVARFYVLALNTIAYQWQENDGIGWYNIDAGFAYASGFTSPILTITDANLGLNGYKYRCIVFDGQGNSDTSEDAILGVNEPPVIVLQPPDRTVCKNDIANFTLSALNASSYQWQENIGDGWFDLTDNAFYSGTNSSTLSVFTTTGMNGFRYRCKVVNGNCPQISNIARLFVNPTPTLQLVTGGGSFCQGGQGVSIGLQSSETSISYHLFRNGLGTGIVLPGTGSAINFGIFTQPGSYTVRAINGSTGCAINMLNEVNVVVNPLPNQQTLLGGGAYCSGNQAPEIFLASSQTHINYELFRNGITTGKTVAGTGFTVSFGTISETGFYTVKATQAQTGCNIQINGSVQVIENAVPQLTAGEDQTIQSGTAAQLQAQAVGGSGTYRYQWQPTAFVVNPQQAVSSTIPLFQSRLFRVSVTDLVSQCASLPDSMMVFVAGGPLSAAINVSETSVCAGNPVTLMATATGGSGIYNYLWTSNPAGFSSGSAQITVNPTQTTTYTVLISDGVNTVNVSATVTVYQLPLAFNVTGGGSYCAGGSGVEIGLSGSQNGVTYTLYLNNQAIASRSGNGESIQFGAQSLQGNYTVTAVNNSSQCQQSMTGAAAIAIHPRPNANAGNNQTVLSGTNAILNGSASGGSGQYHYAWSPTIYIINPNSSTAATLPLFETQVFRLIVTDQTTSCQSNPSETVVFVSGGNSINLQLTASSYSVCPSSEVQLMALASGGSGNYEYQWQSNPPGFQSSVYNPSVSPNITTTYRLTVSDGFTMKTDSVIIEVRALPQVYNISGGGTFCTGEGGKSIGLSNSQLSALYTLWYNGNETEHIRSGNGSPLDFGKFTNVGTYQVKALSLTTLCTAQMIGTAQIQAIQLPQVHAGNDQTILTGQTAQLMAAASGGSGNFSYAWHPASQVVQPNAASTPSLPLQQTTIFSVKATDNQSGCISNADEMTVFVSGNLLQATASASASAVCKGNSIQLSGYASGGNGNYSFYWTSSPSGFYSWEQSPQHEPSETTTYILTVSDGQNVVSAETIVIVNNVPQIFSVTGGGTICHTGGQLPVGLSGSQTGIRYGLWHNQQELMSLTGSGQALSFGLYSSAGNYTVRATETATSCHQNMGGNAVIIQGGEVIADAGPDKYIVSGGQVTLNGAITSSQTSYTFDWSPSSLLLNPEALQPTTTPLSQTTIFRLRAIPGIGGCGITEDYVAVFVSDPGTTTLAVQLYSSQNEICPGESIRLFAIPSGGTSTYNYSWTSDPPGFTSNIYNPVVNPQVSTNYILVVNDGLNQVTDTLTISVKTIPDIYNFSGGGIICSGSQPLSLTLSGSQSGVVYALRRNGYPVGQNLNGTGSTLVFNNISLAGEYSVTALHPAAQCSVNMEGNATVETAVSPVALSSPDITILKGQSTLLSGVASGGSGNYSYSWSPASLVENPSLQNTPTLSLSQTSLFLFTVTDIGTSCVSNTDSTWVFVSGGALMANILSTSTELCTGEPFTLSANVSGGSGSYSIQWKDQAGNLLGTAQQIQLFAQQSQTYTLHINDGDQTTSAEVWIEVVAMPQIQIVEGGGSICNSQNGLPIMLNFAEQGVIYSLYRNNSLIAQILGQGTSLIFGYYTLSGIYTVWAERTGLGCRIQMAGSAQIISFGIPVAEAGPSQTIPYGTTAQLQGTVSGGSGVYNYIWQPQSLLTNPQLLNPVTLPLQNSNLFRLTVTDQLTGCQANDQTLVFVAGGPLQLTINVSNQTICAGQQVRLVALPQGGSGQYSWSWTSKPTSNLPSQSTIDVFPEQTTKYFITINDGFNQLTDSVTVQVLPLPQSFNIVGGGSYCWSETAPEIGLSGSQTGYTYSLLRNGQASGQVFTGSGGLLSFGTIAAAGTYGVMASSFAGCTRLMSGTAEVSVIQPPGNFNFFGGGSYCAQTPGNGLFIGGSEIGVNYRLVRDGTQPIQTLEGNGLPLNFNPVDASGIYSVQAVRQSGGCSRTMTGIATVLLYPIPQLVITGQNSICEGSETLLTASGGDSYTWLVNPPVNDNRFLARPSETTTYTVKATNSFGCSSTKEYEVKVFPLPSFSLSLNPITLVLSLQEMQFVQQISFLTGSTVLQQGMSPEYYFGNALLQQDSIIVIATNALGCETRDAMLVVSQENRINAFSPNTDMINDRFMAGSFIRVFNRWGLEIFTGDEGWDGRYRGVLVAPGTYYYIHEVRDQNGQMVRTQKGSVTLVTE